MDLFDLDNKMFKRIFETSLDGIYIREKYSRKVVWANNRFAEIHGLPLDKIIGLDIRELLTEKGAKIAENYKPGEISGLELEAKGPDGRIITIMVTSGEIDDKYVFGFIRDITELKNMYETLIESENKYSALVQAAMVGIIVIDENENLVFANHAFAEMLGYKNESEIIGKNLVNFTDPDSFRLIISHSFKKRKKLFNYYEANLLTKDGTLKNVLVSAGPIASGKDEKFVGTIAIMNDITERVRSEKFHRQFFQIMTHELKTPLTILRGYIDLLEKTLNANDQVSEDIFPVLKRNIKRLESRIGEINDLSHIERGVFAVNKHPVSMVKFKEILLSDINAFKAFDRIKLDFKFNDEGNYLYFDSERISQVIFNLLDNALRYSPDDTTIEFFLNWTREGLKISVKDYGVGIKKKYLKRLFDPYFSLNISRGGTGLGLFIVKSIIDAHNGTISVETAAGEGTTFRIFIPNETSDLGT